MLADFCKHRFLLSLSPVIPTQCGGVHKMKVTTQPVPLRPDSFCPLPFLSAGDRWFRAYWVISTVQVELFSLNFLILPLLSNHRWFAECYRN